MHFRVNLLSLVLPAVLASAPAYPHAGEDAPTYVANSGVDTGLCRDAAAPCRTIAYALGQLGKGGKIQVATGQYPVSDRDELFHLLNGSIEITGGYDAAAEFKAFSGQPTVLSGVPLDYAEALRERGFRVIADNKLANRDAFRGVAQQLQVHEALKFSMPATPCVGGSVNGMACQRVDLLAHVGFGDISANPAGGADVWGFVDLNTHREYAIMGFDVGTAVFDVTDATNPREVGFLDGQTTAWRDIKVYQYWNAAEARWNAHAYVTTDGVSDGLLVIDLNELPHAIRRVNYSGDFLQAHNVFATNTDFGTGLTLTGATPTLVIAGSSISAGQYRAYSLSNPDAPQFAAMPAAGANDNYMHDAASMIITDSRKDTQCINATSYCELLFDFNETTIDIWDITNASNAVRLSRTPYTNARYVHSGWPSEDQQYLFVHDELDERNAGLNTTVRVFNLANLAAPAWAGTWTGVTSAIDHNGFVRGNRYYMSNYSRGLTILDISNVSQIEAVGRLDTFPGSDGNAFVGAWGVYPFFHSGNIAVSDINSGFYMVVDRSLDVAAGRLAFSSRSYGGDEGEQLQIAVSRLHGSSGIVSVAYEILAASADASDVSVGSGVLNWGNGDAADKMITLELQTDADANEGLEHLFLRLIAPTGSVTLDAQNIASVYVAEAAAAAAVGFAAAEVQIAERGFGTAVAVVHRSGSAKGAVSVDYAVTGGDATIGVDFQGASSGTILWADGDARPQWIEFPIVDDGSGEAEEFFELSLSNAIGASLGSQDILRVTVGDGTGLNYPPHAIVGANQTVNAGVSVTLDGSASNDLNGDALSYQWTQLSGTAVTLSNASSESATFTAPSASSSQVLQFQLSVSDGVAEDTATTAITVRRAGNKGGSGALGWLMLLMLLGATTIRRRHRLPA
ncbi:MAG: choice-of-anchor B family protein [Gammaproteobacteria bacterium]|nr:choice-of-anchor B family protein [Gammaproteobacteria bacterium]MDH5304388.1 choice-of-anchor B family protein [Gammaproteobacteria bacterium]MDH5322109.1 choice-of-anchor B family protein [Gammaproteobacteria bacterium]